MYTPISDKLPSQVGLNRKLIKQQTNKQKNQSKQPMPGTPDCALLQECVGNCPVSKNLHFSLLNDRIEDKNQLLKVGYGSNGGLMSEMVHGRMDDILVAGKSMGKFSIKLLPDLWSLKH